MPVDMVPEGGNVASLSDSKYGIVRLELEMILNKIR